MKHDIVGGFFFIFSLPIYGFVTNIIDWVIELIYLFTLIVDILHIHENNRKKSRSRDYPLKKKSRG